MSGFRTALSNFEVNCPKDEQHYCLVCGLKELHDNYSLLEFSGGGVVDVAQYRLALAELYEVKGKFQLEKTADAMEALGAILHSLHAKASGDPTLGLDEGFTNRSCSPPCPSHQAFALELLEQLRCTCGATSEPLPWDFSSFLLQVYVTDLISILVPARTTRLSGSVVTGGTSAGIGSAIGKFAEALNAVNVSPRQAQRTVEECPDNCPRKRSVKEMQLMSAAEGFVLNLVWSEEHPQAKELVTALALLPSRMSLSRLFPSTHRYPSELMHHSYRLRGFISYGFVHYVSFFTNGDDGQWWKYDDSAVRSVGSYAKLLGHMLEARMHPVGVLYEKEAKEIVVRAAGEQVSETEWGLLERRANEMDIEDAKENAEWECPSCSKNNARGRMVCEACFSLPKGQTGWGCTRCSSRNDEFRNLCGTCYEFRQYICKTCLTESSSAECRTCSGAKQGVLCEKCKIKRARSGGLCESCRTDSGEAEEGTRKSVKQSEILSQSTPSVCPKCKTSLASGECSKCVKDTEALNPLPLSGSSMLRQSVTLPLSTTKCDRCREDKADCECSRISQKAQPPVTTLCPICRKKTGSCYCHLPGKMACVTCGKLPSNCTCANIVSGMCKVCNGRPGECECQPKVSSQSRCPICLWQQCRCPNKAMTSKPSPDKTCISCQRAIPKDKYCSRCLSGYRPADKKCYSCMSYFKGFVCLTCRRKLV